MYRLCSYWETGNETIEIFSVASQYYINDYFNSEYSRILDEIIELFNIGIIHVHHMIGHYFDIADIVKTRKLRMIVSLHDLFCVCPRINKINNINKYCENPDSKECNQCLESYENKNYNIRGIKDITAWEKTWGLLFSLADSIIAPSESARNEIIQRYKNISIDVIEHGIDIYCEKGELDIDVDEEFHVAFVGFLTEIKGKNIIESLVDYSRKLNDNIFFHLFGYMESNIINAEYKNFLYHGEYYRNELSNLFNINKIKLVCIFSICPEVFSYTLSECAASNIPVLAIDMGAVGQRVKENNLGWLIKNNTEIPEIYGKIKNIFTDKKGYKKITEFILNYKIKNTNEMCSEYEKIYSNYYIENYLDNNKYENIQKLKIFIKDNYTISEKIEPMIKSERFLKGELNNKELHIEQLMKSERYLSGELLNKKGHVEQLVISERQLKDDIEKLNYELNKILTSGTWKIVSKIFIIFDKIFPVNSKRRHITKLIIIFVQHPIKFISSKNK
jgi:glycosyltransferase involved in cell wall biosynthesis